jgi:DNA-binding PadR family transcriptional regulator
MRALVDAGLVDGESLPENTRQRRYRITENGEIAFRFFSDPATGTLVRTVLEKA